MNSDGGYFEGNKGKLQVPSNVTRISRAFRRQCSDGTLQIIYYQNGVGSGSTIADSVLGGAFGRGVAEHIREVYSFICSNYSDGDEIVLMGFSRGAFTARSIAGLIGAIGLLTREGMEYFYPVLKDVENFTVKDYDDEFPEFPPLEKRWNDKKGEHENVKPVFGEHDTAIKYAKKLLEKKFTRMNEGRNGEGPEIHIKAVAVWDTVGSLGIPDVSWWNKLGLPQSTKEYHFYDTSLSHRIDYAFQALALDEHRLPFSPAVWETKEDSDTVLKQCWFPGGHGNIGGGWADQQMSDLTLAWMADQLSCIGVEFKANEMVHLFQQGKDFYGKQRKKEEEEKAKKGKSFLGGLWGGSSPPLLWAGAGPNGTDLHCPIYGPQKDRVWALGEIQKASSLLYKLAGTTTRKPGRYCRVNPDKGEEDSTKPLQGTNEFIHPSVRARLACNGLGLNDAGRWTCDALAGWHLEQAGGKHIPVYYPTLPSSKWPLEEDKPPSYPVEEVSEADTWVWTLYDKEADFDDVSKMPKTVLPEERLGFWEKVLLRLTAGPPETDVWRYLMENPPRWPRKKGE